MAAEVSLDGPRIAPRSGTAKQLVVFLHGYGADGNDLIDIGHAWRQWLPDAAFVSPDAPEPCAEAPMGRQWFSIDRSDPGGRWKGVTSVAPVVHRFLDEELKRHGLPPTALALVGFSQGTMIAPACRLAQDRAAARHRRLFRPAHRAESDGFRRHEG